MLHKIFIEFMIIYINILIVYVHVLLQKTFERSGCGVCVCVWGGVRLWADGYKIYISKYEY